MTGVDLDLDRGAAPVPDGVRMKRMSRFWSFVVSVTLLLLTVYPAVASASERLPGQAASVCDSPQLGSAATPDEQQQMVDLHNALRAKYGSPPLVWDATLASCAQDWAQQRAAGVPGPHRPDNPYGENVFSNWSCCDPATFASSPADAMSSWSGEEANYDVTSNMCKPGAVCGHFTQVVWSTTTKVGCGKAVVPNTPQPNATTAYWVCNYGPAGNITGQTPFAPRAALDVEPSPTPAAVSTDENAPTTAGPTDSGGPATDISGGGGAPETT